MQLALAAGLRANDTANQLVYYEEALVGEALRAVAQQGVRRETLFLCPMPEVEMRVAVEKKSLGTPGTTFEATENFYQEMRCPRNKLFK